MRGAVLQPIQHASPIFAVNGTKDQRDVGARPCATREAGVDHVRQADGGVWIVRAVEQGQLLAASV
jgi:hypothetical protein